MTHITEILILSEPTQVPHDGSTDSSGSTSSVLGYGIFAVVAVSVIAVVLILKRSSNGEQKWSLRRVLAAAALAAVAAIGAVVSVVMCLDSLRGFFS